MIGIIAVDLDGTLLAADHRTVPADEQRALGELAARGAHVVPASGRALALMRHELRQIPFVRYVVSSNGASVIDRCCAPPALRTSPLSAQRAHDLYTLFDGYDLSLELYHDGAAYLERRHVRRFRSSFTPHFAAHLAEHTFVVDSLEPLLDVGAVGKLNISGVREADRPEITARLARWNDLAITTSLNANIEITAAGVTKVAALSWLAGRLGVDRRDVVAFGDSDNDVGMLEWAGLSYAMVGGTAAAKAAAGRVVDPDAGEAISTVLETLIGAHR